MYKFNKAVVFKGRAAQIAVCFVDENGNNLFTCGITGSSIRVQNQDDTFIEKSASTGIAWGLPDATYMYVYDFTNEETALFKQGLDQSIFLEIFFGANSMKYELKKFICNFVDVF